MESSRLPELLLVDKPKGITSFDVIRQLRKRTGIRKFGHAGTLDPLASGLMLIGVGPGTKLLTSLIGLDKEYVAIVLIGESRTTGDLEGEVLEVREYEDDLNDEKIKSALESMLGALTLQVSAYSAIKVGGKPLYKKARAAAKVGETVALLPVREMVVHEAELLDTKSTVSEQGTCLLLRIRFKVSSGTYIRSLAEELGRRLGYPATLADLRRTKVGHYSIEEARSLDSF